MEEGAYIAKKHLKRQTLKLSSKKESANQDQEVPFYAHLINKNYEI